MCSRVYVYAIYAIQAGIFYYRIKMMWMESKAAHMLLNIEETGHEVLPSSSCAALEPLVKAVIETLLQAALSLSQLVFCPDAAYSTTASILLPQHRRYTLCFCMQSKAAVMFGGGSPYRTSSTFAKQLLQKSEAKKQQCQF